VAAELTAGGRDEVAFVGTPDGPEARLAREAGLEFLPLAARGFDRSSPLSLPVALGVLFVSTWRAVSMLRRLRPNAVVGFGGYVCLPLGLAAILTRIPLVLHEQNSVPGLANRFLARWARAVAVTYRDTAAAFPRRTRVEVTGNPVRHAVLGATRESGRAVMGLADDAVVLLVFGGSRGARHLNQATINLYQRLMEVDRLQVVHVAGRIEAAAARERLDDVAGGPTPRYRIIDYAEDMGSALAAADVVVARAGATSLAEITAIGRASLLVPYPFATGDHQTGNARELAEAGAAHVVADAALDTDAFADALFDLLLDGSRRAAMASASRALARPRAACAVADLVRGARTEVEGG